ncbi:hypothetical protein ACLKA6_003442 [Drosophila palustris]
MARTRNSCWTAMTLMHGLQDTLLKVGNLMTAPKQQMDKWRQSQQMRCEDAEQQQTPRNLLVLATTLCTV